MLTGESIEEITPDMMSTDDQLELMGDIFDKASPMLEELGNLYQSGEQLTTEQLGELQQLQQNIIELGQQIKTFEKVTTEKQFKEELEYQQTLMKDQSIETGMKDLDESLALIMATYHVLPAPTSAEEVVSPAPVLRSENDIEQELFEQSIGPLNQTGSLADDGLTIFSEGPGGTIIGEWSPEALKALQEITPKSEAADSSLDLSEDFLKALDKMAKPHK